jgi:hypothetical protein
VTQPPAAGYSGTPLPAKLGLRPGARVALVRAPAGFESALQPLPDGVRVLRRLAPPVDAVVCFCPTRRHLERDFGRLAAILPPAGALWVAWPKKASGVPTDLTEGSVREVGLAGGLVDNKVCAIDGTWSGLRFVRRSRDRPTTTPETS